MPRQRKRHAMTIGWKTKKIRVEFLMNPAEPDVGIMSDYSEDHSLHDPENEQRLTDLEAKMTDSDWGDIARTIDEEFRYPDPALDW